MFFVILSNVLIIPVAKENIKVKHAPAIPTGAPRTLIEEIIQTPSLAELTTVKVLSM